MTAGELTMLVDRKSADVGRRDRPGFDRPSSSLATGALIRSASAQGWDVCDRIAGSQAMPSGGCCGRGARRQGRSTLLVGGLGTAAGVGIDALIHRDREVYRRGAGAVATVAPVLGRGVGGAAISVTWYSTSTPPVPRPHSPLSTMRRTCARQFPRQDFRPLKKPRRARFTGVVHTCLGRHEGNCHV